MAGLAGGCAAHPSSDRPSRGCKPAGGASRAQTRARKAQTADAARGPSKAGAAGPHRRGGRSLPGAGHVHRPEAAAGPGPRVPAVLVLHAGSGAAAARAAASPHVSPPLRKRRRVTPPCRRRAASPQSPPLAWARRAGTRAPGAVSRRPDGQGRYQATSSGPAALTPGGVTNRAPARRRTRGFAQAAGSSHRGKGPSRPAPYKCSLEKPWARLLVPVAPPKVHLGHDVFSPREGWAAPFREKARCVIKQSLLVLALCVRVLLFQTASLCNPEVSL